jgi:NADH pyrophosphatase NudC (nudix superfamily)
MQTKRNFCSNCGAEITETDVEAGYCTQCKEPISPEPLPLIHALLRSLRELQGDEHLCTSTSNA